MSFQRNYVPRKLLKKLAQSRGRREKVEASAEAIAVEDSKVERHILMLAVAAAPVGSALIALTGLVQVEQTIAKSAFTVSVLLFSVACCLRIGLLIVARDKILTIRDAIHKKETRAELIQTRQVVEDCSEYLTAAGYVTMLAFLILVVWL